MKKCFHYVHYYGRCALRFILVDHAWIFWAACGALGGILERILVAHLPPTPCQNLQSLLIGGLCTFAVWGAGTWYRKRYLQ
ncbi:hypothetical protein [Oecophyllibacter saccharovorans]|uniref:Uncharacterized protein n=1 Tax=Oecophyllibacter saccharovorans TaxID=2558360 RepID=A0A506UKV2_9PROT|nr:hypothetical protein [Oecophyllibacter saccharovorans]TPW33862.1 hypothetical protein E3202_04520 [Oecophyllibacter saccharovorans]